MKLISLLAVAAGLALTSPALAKEETIDYSGVITATPDPTQAYDLKVGTPVTFSVTFDPATLMDDSGVTFYDGVTGLPVSLPGIRTASLSDDPNAAFTVTLGEHTFTKTDDSRYGTDEGLGTGNFPTAIFQGSTFVGVSFEGEDQSDGFVTLQDPIGLALHYLPAYGFGGDNNSPNTTPGFLISTDLPLVQVASAPEPATWALILLAVGFAGWALRRGARRSWQLI